MSLSHVVRRAAICAGLAGIVGTVLSGCGSGGTPPPVTGSFTAPGTSPFLNSDNANRTVFQQNPHQNGRARWTVLVYLNAASNLQPDSLINVAQMASVGSTADLNIVLQWKQTATNNYFSTVAVATTPSFIGTRRYKLGKHNQSDLKRIAPTGIDSNAALVGDTSVLDPDRLPDPPTNTIPESGNTTADMGDYRTLADFVAWGTKNYPADQIALVIWDHGSGALNNSDGRAVQGVRTAANRAANVRLHGSGTMLQTGTKPRTRGLSQDVQTGSQIATQQLPLALASAAQTIDALIIDCSLQGTIEVAYDVRNSARIFVGSEESPPGTGYPYDAWLGFLQTTPASAGDAGKNLIQDTVAAYPSATNITQSMTDLSKLDAVAAAVNSFGGSLRNYVVSQSTLILTARQAAQFFDFAEYKDLYHFADLIRTSSGVPSDLAQAAANVETSLLGTKGAILMSAHDASTNEAKASGLSIFLPGPQTVGSADGVTGFDPAYNQLGFAKAATNWGSFLQSQQQ